MIKHSATLAINETMAARRKAGLPVLHLGFGEAGLPVPDDVSRVLANATQANAYAPVAGTEAARDAAAGYCSRRDLPTSAAQILMAPGSKALLYAALAAIPGDLILPQPSWVSYAAQAALTHKEIIGVPIPAAAGGIPDPALLDAAIVQAKAAGKNPQVMILTLPDNPTGTLAAPDAVEQVCAIARKHDLTIIADEIYRDLVYQPGNYVSPATHYPERTIVTNGLSKNMALGGWRIGFARLPDNDFGRELHARMIGIASEIWSSLPGPMQLVAAYVLNEPDTVTQHIQTACRLHAQVSKAVHACFVDAGAACRTPTAAFYCYPDFAPIRDKLAAMGFAKGTDLSNYLLDTFGLAILAGEHFGGDPAAFRYRVASSLMYGDTSEQRWQALGSDDPVRLPWIAAKLEQLQSALASLARTDRAVNM